MKLFKIALVVLLFLVNLVVAQPTFADKKYTENPDYIAVTQALDTLLQEKNTQGDTIDNVRKIAKNAVSKIHFGNRRRLGTMS